jgi:hypothetical protein
MFLLFASAWGWWTITGWRLWADQTGDRFATYSMLVGLGLVVAPCLVLLGIVLHCYWHYLNRTTSLGIPLYGGPLKIGIRMALGVASWRSSHDAA